MTFIMGIDRRDRGRAQGVDIEDTRGDRGEGWCSCLDGVRLIVLLLLLLSGGSGSGWMMNTTKS